MHVYANAEEGDIRTGLGRSGGALSGTAVFLLLAFFFFSNSCIPVVVVGKIIVVTPSVRAECSCCDSFGGIIRVLWYSWMCFFF